MKRVYRLLRDNKEFGPFAIDELLGQTLHPSDMLWIDGRSSAWSLLSEIELTPSKETETEIQEDSKNDDIETRANQIRKRVMNFRAQQPEAIKEEKGDGGEMHYYIPAGEKGTIEFVDHRKQKSTMISDMLMTGVVICLFVGGLYGGKILFFNKEQNEVQPVTQAVSKDEHPAKSTAIVTTNSVPLPATDTMQPLALQKPKTSAKKLSGDINRANKRVTAIEVEGDISNETALQKAITESNGAQNDSKEEVASIKEMKIVNIKEEAPEKKNGLFKKLFGKKKKEE